MNSHKNARLAAAGRLRLVQAVEGGVAVARVAQDFRLSARTVWKWGGAISRARRRQIWRGRQRRWSSRQIAQHYKLPLSTVVTVQRRLSSARRTGALFGYLRFYNTARRHSALQFQTPAPRVAERL